MDRALTQILQAVSTATLTTLLLKSGLTRTWMQGPAPLQAGQPRVVGPAFTLRFIPAREDVSGSVQLAGGHSTRAAIEAMPAGAVVVAEVPDTKLAGRAAGVMGDILAARMQQRGVAGLVTDGAVRDAAGVGETGLNVWCAGAAAPPSYAALTFIGWQQPIGCGGVAVFPDDVIIADGDGAVVIPAAMAMDIAEQAAAQEDLESWIMDQVTAGRELPGLYPPNANTLNQYEKDRARGKNDNE